MRVFIRFTEMDRYPPGTDVEGCLVLRREDFSLDFIDDGQRRTNLHPSGYARMCFNNNTVEPFDIRYYPYCPTWTQVWPREASQTALAMMHVACRGKFGLPKEIARLIGMHIFAGRDVPHVWGRGIS